jgi:hypothetical protein
MVCAGQISPRVVARQRKSRDVRLGVKWSPFLVLSQPTMSLLAIAVVRRTAVPIDSADRLSV